MLHTTHTKLVNQLLWRTHEMKELRIQSRIFLNFGF